MVELAKDDLFLSSVRNAFILLLVGLTLFEFGGRLSKMATIVFVVVALLIILSLYNYWSSPDYSSLGGVPLAILIMLGVVLWLIYESWRNPKQLFENDRIIQGHSLKQLSK